MLEDKQTSSTCVLAYFMALVRKSECLCGLSDEAKQRYESKVVGTGLSVDPYLIDSWTRDPETIPQLTWSDVMLFTWFPLPVHTLKKQ